MTKWTKAYHVVCDQVQCETNPCVAAKLDVSIFCDDLLDIPCSSNLDTCSSSMFVKLTL
jgi:hypothetical protein